MKKYGCIYKLTNKINGKVYIGQTIMLDENDIPTKRWSKYKYLHCELQPKLYNALKKYSPDNFSFEVLEYCYSKKEIDCKECSWMDKFDSIARGYNVKEGGAGGAGLKHSQETRKKISLALKGQKISPATRKKISLAMKDRKLSQEWKDKIGLANKGKPSWIKGKNHSQETKDKMSLIHKGKKMSQESREKMSLAFKGRKHSQETKDKMSSTHGVVREKILKTRYTKNLKKYNLIYPLDLDKYKRIKKAENDLYRQFRAHKKASK